MGSALVWVRARLTGRRRAVVIGFAAVPLLVVVVLLVGVATGFERLAAVAALAVILVAVIASLLVVGVALRRWRHVRSVLDGESIDRATVPQPVADSARASRLAAGRAAAGIPLPLVAGFGMATRSPFALEQLAGLATSWRSSVADVEAVVRGSRDPEVVAAALGPVDPVALLLLARTLASRGDADAFADALVRHVAATADTRTLPLTARQLLAERLVMIGELAEAARTLGASSGTTAGHLVALDTINPFVRGARQHDEGVWLAALNSSFRRAGLEGIILDAEGATPFDRLGAEPAPVTGGPLVSVVMTAYRPDPEALRTAVAAVRAQSWTDWELILVDDGSPSAEARAIAGVAATDPRIRLLRFDDNRGAYQRRNDALAVAVGEYATFQDADDWMHPRRLEIQVGDLERRPRRGANLVRSARVTPELRFVQARGTLLRLTESSLLFRRERTLATVGVFDEVRKAGDTSFRHRLEAVRGEPVPVLGVGAPLVLSRFSDASLSGADLRDGWTHPARVAYSSAHATWVADERAAGRAPRLDVGSRPFVAPAVLRGEPVPSYDVDVLIVLDVRDDPRRRRAARLVDAQVARLAARGLAVGVRRADALLSTWVAPAARRPLQRLVNAGTIVEVLPDDEVRAAIVAVPDERCLLGIGDGRAVGAARIVVARSEAASGTDGVAWERSETLAGARRLVADRDPELVDAVGLEKLLAEVSAR